MNENDRHIYEKYGGFFFLLTFRKEQIKIEAETEVERQMKKHSKMSCLSGRGFLTAMLLLSAVLFFAWKLPQETSFIQETGRVSSESRAGACMWSAPAALDTADVLFQRTSRTLVFAQLRAAEKTVQTEHAGRYQSACLLAVWYIGFLLPQLTVRGLRKRLVGCQVALWRNIDYIHHLDGKKKASVAISETII